MKPVDLGIYAPYACNGTTAMACSLADVVKAIGYSVEYWADPVREKDVHFRWDADIRSRRGIKFGSWALRCNSMIWFDFVPARLRTSIKAGCRNVFVPMWHNAVWPTGGPGDTSDCRFDKIVCSHVSAYSLMKLRFGNRLHLSEWCQEPRVHRRTNLVNPGQLTIYVSINSRSMAAMSGGLLSALRLLLDSRESLNVIISYSKRWARDDDHQARSIARQFKDRFRLLPKPDYRLRQEMMKKADWVFCASTAADSWWDASEALSFGIPVVCFDIPPYTDLIVHNYNGMVIRCLQERTESGAVRAVVNSKSMLDALSQLVKNDQRLYRLHAQAWPDMENRTFSFQQFWSGMIRELIRL